MSDTPVFALRSQYLKDLSFENPHAPGVFLPRETAPQIDVQVGLKATGLQEGIFELTLHLSVRANEGETALFIIELDYAGLFELRGLEEAQAEQALLVQGAFLLFPFARRVVADVVRDGGFPPLNLEPMDFHALYLRQRGK